jgi:hypothetical protein
MRGRPPGPCRKKPPGTHGHNQSTELWQTRGPRCHRSDSSGTPSPRDPARRRPWGRTHWRGPGSSPGVPERCGGAWWSRAGADGRAGRGREPTACLVMWTTGFSGEWWVPVWPRAAPGVERSGVGRLDVKDGRWRGRGNGRRARHGGHDQPGAVRAPYPGDLSGRDPHSIGRCHVDPTTSCTSCRARSTFQGTIRLSSSSRIWSW